MAANVPIYLSQGGTTLTVDAGGTLDTTNGNVTFGPVAIGPDGVATANIQDGAVTTDKIADGDVTTDKIAPLAVTDAELDVDAVHTDKILDGAVTSAKAAIFVSPVTGGGILAGTGMAQNIPHGLGVVPSVVLVIPIDTSGSADAWTVTYGATTDTNIVVTVSAMATFVALAWA